VITQEIAHDRPAANKRRSGLATASALIGMTAHWPSSQVSPSSGMSGRRQLLPG
jgi:hypothetical protein